MAKMISETQSICPICQKPIKAFYVEESALEQDAKVTDTCVYFIQECPEHGEFRTLASESAEDFKTWVANPVVNIPPKQAITKGDPEDKSCPLNCGTCENHLQTTCCVLIDVTQRCNQNCPYCFALAGDAADPSEPTLEEISKKYDWLLQQGEEGREFNIQLSGGEPTVRDDLPEIIKMARDKGFQYVQINSNGRRLAEEEGYAKALQEAGASVIFMQFDGTHDDIYMKLRGEPLFEKKVQAIRNCEKAGLAVTLVPTVVRGVNDDNLGEMMDFLVENVNVVKGVHFQPASFFGRYPSGDELEGRITMFGLLRELEAQRPQFCFEDSLPISTGHTLCCFYSTYIKEPDGSVRCTITQKQKNEGVSCCDTQDGATSMDCCCCGSEEETTESTDCCCCGGEEETAESTDCCCCGGEEETTESTDCCCCGGEEETTESTDCCCCGGELTEAEKLEIIKKDRDYVLDKWDISIPEDSCSCHCGEAPKYTSSEKITDMDEFLTYYKRNTFTVTGMAFQDLTNLDAERLKRCRVVQLTDDYRLIPFCAYNTIYRSK